MTILLAPQNKLQNGFKSFTQIWQIRLCAWLIDGSTFRVKSSKKISEISNLVTLKSSRTTTSLKKMFVSAWKILFLFWIEVIWFYSQDLGENTKFINITVSIKYLYWSGIQTTNSNQVVIAQWLAQRLAIGFKSQQGREFINFWLKKGNLIIQIWIPS